MKPLRYVLLGVLIVLIFVLGAPRAWAQCPEDDPDCPLAVPQSEQVNPDPANAAGSSENVGDAGSMEQIESVLPGQGPIIIAPVPIESSNGSPPNFEKLDLPLLEQDPSDPTCGIQALGMAMGSGENPPNTDVMYDFLLGEGMMYDIGTGVEELAYAAHEFDFGGSEPFHGGDLDLLKGELDDGRAPVVALGSNGVGQPGHFVTVTGISPDGGWISYNDPTLGEVITTTGEFSRLWALQDNSGVIVKKTVAPGALDPGPWVAFVAGLMALLSQTPLLLRRTGSGGRLISAGSGGTRRRKDPPTIGPHNDPSPQMLNRQPIPRHKNAENTTDDDDSPPSEPDTLWTKILAFFGVDTALVEEERHEYEQYKEDQLIDQEQEYSEYVAYLKGLEYEQYFDEQEEIAEFERQEHMTAEARERERLRRVFEEREPIEYVRQYVYQANQIDLHALAEIPQDNVLTMEFINDNSRYPGSLRPVMAMNFTAGENVAFLKSLDLRTEFMPNFEPAYFNELVNQYPVEYRKAVAEYNSRGLDAFDEWLKKLYGRANSGTVR